MYLLWRRSVIGFTACKVSEIPANGAGQTIGFVDKYTLTEDEERYPTYILEVMYPCRVQFEKETNNTS